LRQARDPVDNYATMMTSLYLGLTSARLTNGSGGSIPYQLEYYKHFNISMQPFSSKASKQYQHELKFSYQTDTRKLPMR
jgi:L-serine deaminase